MRRLALLLLPLCMGMTETETVTIYGPAGGGGGLSGNDMARTGGWSGSGRYSSADSDGGWTAEIALNAVNLSTDVRCNPVAQANDLVRTTTSASDRDTKFLAANTLFRLIYAQLGGSAMQSALAIMPKAANVMNGIKNAVLWKTTWGDGSSSTFLVFPFLPPLFTDQQPEVGGDTPPDGNTACPPKA